MGAIADAKVDGDFELGFTDDISEDFRVGFSLETTFASEFGPVENVYELFFDAGSGISDGVNNTAPVGVLAIP